MMSWCGTMSISTLQQPFRFSWVASQSTRLAALVSYRLMSLGVVSASRTPNVNQEDTYSVPTSWVPLSSAFPKTHQPTSYNDIGWRSFKSLLLVSIERAISFELVTVRGLFQVGYRPNPATSISKGGRLPLRLMNFSNSSRVFHMCRVEIRDPQSLPTYTTSRRSTCLRLVFRESWKDTRGMLRLSAAKSEMRLTHDGESLGQLPHPSGGYQR